MKDKSNNTPAYGSKYDMLYQYYSYTASISSMNQWYKVLLHSENKFWELRDSAKLLPLTLAQIGKDFQCRFQKLEMEYSGTQHKAFGPISNEELEYIKNDVRVLSEAVWKARNEYNLKELTIGACSLKEMKACMGGDEIFELNFPDLTEYPLDLEDFPNVYTYVRKAYTGGWCYVNPRYANQVFATKEGLELIPQVIGDNYRVVDNIWCYDRNSMYPSVMHSSPNDKIEDWGQHWYPVGEPVYRKGEPTKEILDDCYVFRRFKCHFDLKERRFPWVHIRCDSHYRAHDCLETDKYRGKEVFPDGTSTAHEFIMTQTDYELFKYCYDTHTDDGQPGEEAIDYIFFQRDCGMFDSFIDKWMAIKEEAKRTGDKTRERVSKLIMNSSYGKTGSGTNNDNRFIETDEEGRLVYKLHEGDDSRKTVAPAVAAAITSYARSDMVRLACANFDTFVYSDTDSEHGFSDGELQPVVKDVDPTRLGYWDMEVGKKSGLCATWCKQKTYIEFDRAFDKKKGEYYNKAIIRAAGLSDNGKSVLEAALLLDSSKKSVITQNNGDDYEVPKLYLSDFRPGFGLKGVNLKAKNIIGGTLLSESDFSLS